MTKEKENSIKFTFNANERLKSKKLITALFSKRTFIQDSSIRMFYIPTELNDINLQFGFSVSKKSFPLAVQRNKIKRLLREAVRLQKPFLIEKLTENQKKYAIMFTYLGKEIPKFLEVQKVVLNLFKKIEKI